jgi:hypothetical protein
MYTRKRQSQSGTGAASHMKSNDFLTEEELKMLLTNDVPEPTIADKPQSASPLLPRSAKHGKKTSFWQQFFRKK